MLFRHYVFKALLRNFRFYRKFYGGTWESWWLEDAKAFVWIHTKEEFYHSTRFECCRRGCPLIEIYPEKEV
jgi:hypothetical protein